MPLTKISATATCNQIAAKKLEALRLSALTRRFSSHPIPEKFDLL